eukprot:11181886-Lingulodinium_polyedra.AAC.1
MQNAGHAAGDVVEWPVPPIQPPEWIPYSRTNRAFEAALLRRAGPLASASPPQSMQAEARNSACWPCALANPR